VRRSGADPGASMIRASVTINVLPDQCFNVLRALRSFLGPTRTERGCLECNLYQDAEDPSRLSLIEEWDDEDHFQRRLRSKEYRNLLMVMELASAPPTIRIDFVNDRRGMEAIHAARTGHPAK
jgi:quinol monooxygenase YgiN